MHDWFAGYGYYSLFLLSFLASTLIPLGSEWLLVAMLLAHYDPLKVVAVATAGNYLGALSTYWIGLYGGDFLKVRVLRMDEQSTQKAERFYQRFGSYSLLLSFLPVIGDPLCLVGGVLRVGFLRFTLLVASGKLARYAAVAWMTIGLGAKVGA
ncbi:DedA family protein [Geomonas sp. Red32]|uniref:YqaA family protein n=1 Tax=Geomonas sp. Red32 TaxID=2912856 RepID=UPI00202CAE56|nr:YqaA family protein [Geomonas sp. Red32]MCM0083979.1 DedA family protein [Geomonas sp. Red32]